MDNDPQKVSMNLVGVNAGLVSRLIPSSETYLIKGRTLYLKMASPKISLGH